ncbi:protein phosphatase-like protein PP1 regulatory subunit sds22 [Calycina marina]|uniref:Protein phosphatase-like protein PP1 regulatory subunit sds22 n=1 Tax=Calycina marina TaxID=1763456 RepID=A0A9P7YWB1_9HELO|nr:protein phosphatase-like protein PP1 regulatory subunit sds22 [Calycina marina]
MASGDAELTSQSPKQPVTPGHITICPEDIEGHEGNDTPKSAGTPRSSSGWDGKLRLDKVENKLEIVNPEAISDPEYSDEEHVLEGEVIPPDEDLLDDYDVDTEEIDCIHTRMRSLQPLKLDRFNKVKRICFRQNVISDIECLSHLAPTLTELDFYDNLIAHIRGLEDLVNLAVLDLSFNKIKHIKRINHLTKLTDLYFVQNKISTIEGLDGLTKLKTLELAANRIREIQNLESLESLENLWLGKNKITEIKGLDSLQNLTLLSIQSNRIRELSGLDKLANLEELYISHNALTSLKGLENVRKLRVLDISNNQITSMQGINHLEYMEELWASYNQFGDFNEIESEMKDLKKLTTVYFEGNPLQLIQPALYRNKVRLMLPQLIQIDATHLRVS